MWEPRNPCTDQLSTPPQPRWSEPNAVSTQERVISPLQAVVFFLANKPGARNFTQTGRKREERKQKLRVCQRRWGKVRTNGPQHRVGCGARVRAQGPAPVRVPQEFLREVAGPLGSYRPVARASLLRPGEGVNLRSPQASWCALKQPPAPGDLGSQVNNVKP